MDGMNFDFSMRKYDLEISPPLMNAAGSLGFVLESSGPVDLAQLGAFITNPISLQKRTPARRRTCQPYPGGYLLHSGYPNPGLRAAIRRYAARWARSPIPIIVHLLAENIEGVSRMVPLLEELEGVMGIELGLPPAVDLQSAQELVQAALGELPLIVRLPVEKAGMYAQSLANSQITAISLGPPRGALYDSQGRSVRGRLYGPSVFPQTLASVQEAISAGVPVIAAGGVYKQRQVEALMESGAIAVQLDAVLWSLGWEGQVG
jgi:dihydroorotate dehydrogenase (NAD+) catalytic subunit